MSSTSNSNIKENSSSKDVVCSIKNLNISFEFNHHQVHNLRDSFVSLMKSPVLYLFKGREQNHVIKDLSLDIYKGDRVGIVGVNGAGKTSLCRSIAGMCHPQFGDIKVDGDVRAIFDTSVGIMEDLTGRENAKLIVELLFPKLSKEQKEEFVNEAIEFSELGEFIDTPYHTYSKGMQSRLCLSLISGHASDLLILDEVFDGADEFFRKKIANRVLKMIKSSGAVIFVSHSIPQIEESCNQLVVLKDGKISFDGGVEEGISHYHKLYE